MRKGAKISLIIVSIIAVVTIIGILFFYDQVCAGARTVERVVRAPEISMVKHTIEQNQGKYGVSDNREEGKESKGTFYTKLIKGGDSCSSIITSASMLQSLMLRINKAVNRNDSEVQEMRKEALKTPKSDIYKLLPAKDTIYSKSSKAHGIELPSFQESGVSVDLSDYYYYRIGYIPDYQKKLFCDLGWKVVFASDDLEKITWVNEYDDETELWGLCQYYEKTIYLKVKDGANGASIVHEMGHFMDFVQGRVSFDDDFLSAYEQDKEEFEDNFWYVHLDEIPERYAEAYEAYYTSPVKLSNRCPHIYDYFETHL